MDDQIARPSKWLEQLPALTGWRWRAFVGVWLATLALALAACAMMLPDILRSAVEVAPTSAMAGLTVFTDGSAAKLGPPIGREAERSGLRQGDRLVRVDGSPAAVTTAGIARQLAGPVGSKLTIIVTSPDGTSSSHRLTRDPSHYREALLAAGLRPSVPGVLQALLALVGAGLLPVICAAILLVRRSRDRLAPWASLMMLFFVLGNQPGFALTAKFPDPTLANYIFNTLGFGGYIFVLAAFPEGRFNPRWSLAVALIGPITCAITQPLPTAEANLVLVLNLAAAVVAIAVRYRAMPPGIGRQQIRWALLGFAASIAALIALVVLQALIVTVQTYGTYVWLRMGTAVTLLLLNSLFILGITFGLPRYRLYDADAVISRSVVYGALTLSLLAIFAGSEKVIEAIGERFFGEELGALAGGLSAGIAAVMIAPIHHRVSHWAEHRFRSGLGHLRHGLPLLVGDLRETASPRLLADAVLTRVEKGVRARHGAVIVAGDVLDARDVAPDVVHGWLSDAILPADPGVTLDCDRNDQLFPMRVPLKADGAGLVGWLLLGPRPDGSFYGREDRAALLEIADPVARGLAIALMRERQEADRREREDNLIRKFEALRSFVRNRLGAAEERQSHRPT